MNLSLAKATVQVLEGKPYAKYGLEQGIVNYSALAKALQPEVEGILNRRRQY